MEISPNGCIMMSFTAPAVLIVDVGAWLPDMMPVLLPVVTDVGVKIGAPVPMTVKVGFECS